MVQIHPTLPTLGASVSNLDPKFFKDVEKLICSGWTKNALARKGNNHCTDPLHPKAKTFCLDGAIRKVADNWGIPHNAYQVFLSNFIKKKDPVLTLHRFNDKSELLEIRKVLQQVAKEVRRKT